jgi:hypothetical protein
VTDRGGRPALTRMTRPRVHFVPVLALLTAACTFGSPSDSDPDPDPDSGDDGSDPTGDDDDDDGSTGVDGESSDDGNPFECPAGNGPTEHQDGATQQVWRAEDSPHVIPYDMTVSAAIAIEPCSTVQMGAGITVTVVPGGSIRAEGDAEGPIAFERLESDPWVSIRLLGGTMALSNVLLDGGGDPLSGPAHIAAAVLVRAPSGTTAPEGVLAVRDVEIRGSQSQGVRLEENGAFTSDSEGLVILDGAGHPISAGFDVAGSIPRGEYTGNGDDRIVLTDELSSAVAHDMTLFDRGVPYVVGPVGQLADLRVDAGPGAAATLTIEAGVEMQFRAGGVVRIDPDAAEEPATGALVAMGTEDAPVVFTSAEDAPAAGDWLGLVFGSELAAHTRMDHVQIEFAGGESSSGSNSCPYPGGDGINEASIRILGVPPGEFITNLAVVAGANHGIDRGWRDDTVVDFLSGNDFDVAGCRQTVSRLDDGVCPDPVPCE